MTARLPWWTGGRGVLCDAPRYLYLPVSYHGLLQGAATRPLSHCQATGDVRNDTVRHGKAHDQLTSRSTQSGSINHLLHGVSQPSKVHSHLLLCVVAGMMKLDLHTGLQFCLYHGSQALRYRFRLWLRLHCQRDYMSNATSWDGLTGFHVFFLREDFLVLIRVQTNLFPRPIVDLVNPLACLNTLLWSSSGWVGGFLVSISKLWKWQCSTATQCLLGVQQITKILNIPLQPAIVIWGRLQLFELACNLATIYSLIKPAINYF